MSEGRIETESATQTEPVQIEGVRFLGLEERHITEVERHLEGMMRQVVNDLRAGTTRRRYPDCRRVDLTNKKICVEITIEDYP